MFAFANRGLKYIDRGNLTEPDFELEDFTPGDVDVKDLSNIIPIGTKIVLLRVTAQESTTPTQVMISTNGVASGYNTLNNWTQVTDSYLGFQGFVKPTADRKISVSLGAGTWTLFEVVINGYFV